MTSTSILLVTGIIEIAIVVIACIFALIRALRYGVLPTGKGNPPFV